MRLDQYLLKQGLSQDQKKAAGLIMAGQVKVSGELVTKPGFMIKGRPKVQVLESDPYVSRAGGKLASVADKFALDFKDKIVLDVGSSTGGFTDYALQNGAKRVYAVDVGTGQLDWKLRNTPEVVSMEKTDIRDVANLPDRVDIITVDVSFISILSIIPSLINLMNKNTLLVAMVKPQFEADYITASKHKGVIKNDTIRRRILSDVQSRLEDYFVIVEKKDSQIKGVKGNTERFFLLKKLRAKK